MGNYVISLIRTYVPVAVGAAASWALIHYKLHVSHHQQVAASVLLSAGVTAVYYAGVRALEAKFPKLGVLLGHTAKPVYQHH